MSEQKRLLIPIFIMCLFTACKWSKENREIVKKGFVLFSDDNYWYFVPAQSVDTINCFQNLNSENLGKGFQFQPSNIPNLSYLKRTFDSIPGSLSSLQITAVELQFSFEKKYSDLYTSEDKDPKWNFTYSEIINGQRIEFLYNIFPVTIHRAEPIFCMGRKRAGIRQCSCVHDEYDSNDYLFKICTYIKNKDPYTDLPCRYQVKSIEEDTLEGRAVTKVALSCCFLGDVAYFDPSSKELIGISYGAR